MTQTFYHVPSPAYRDGDDLLCWDYLLEDGLVTASDWKHIWIDVEDEETGAWVTRPMYVDTALVSLSDSRLAAIAIIGNAGFDTTRLLRIDLPDTATIAATEEGWPAIEGSIGAQYITVEPITVTPEMAREAETALNAVFEAQGR